MVLLESKTEKQNSQCEHGQQMEQTKGCQVRLAVNHRSLSLLANELDVRSVLHGQVSLAAVNQRSSSDKRCIFPS